MSAKKWILPAFVFIALVQLYVPAKMIIDREDVLTTGKEFKFLTAPVDPLDPFRGRYITLSFDQNSIEIDSTEKWMRDEDVFVGISKGDDGFAKIKDVSRKTPSNGTDFVKAKVNYVSVDSVNKLMITYPFERYYMEESKAGEAEQTYQRAQPDTTKKVYALVMIKNGNAVLKDVTIDGVSIKEILKAGR